MSDQTEFVYLIGSEGSPIVKIGRSIDVPGRLAAIQYMSPLKLAVLWQTKGGAELEAALHRHFKAQRSHGEWFEFPSRDAPERVACAFAEVVAQMRQTKKARKVRKVWTAPSRQREQKPPPITSLAGYCVGDVVLILRKGWDSRTGVIRYIAPGEHPYVVEENDGHHHHFLPGCTEAEIAHQDTVAELPCGDGHCDGLGCAVLPCGDSLCRAYDCMCLSSQRGHGLRRWIGMWP